MSNQFNSPEGDLENYFVSDYWLIDQYIGDQLWTWGYNSFAQLGINNTTRMSTPVTTFAGGTNWKQISCGISHTAAIKTDGTLWVWGSNFLGKLGTNNTINRSTPVTTFAGGTNWKQVSCGKNNTSAIKTDGTLWTWGHGALGRLGNNEGTDKSTPVTTFAGGTNWKQVSCGSAVISAIKTDGTLWIWGSGSSGKLGTNDTTNRSTPVTTFAGGTNWKQVSCGDSHISAIKTDGTLWGWGYNGRSQLAIGDSTSRSTPVTTFAGGTNWKQVSCGYNHTSSIKTDGTLWTWGNNITGQLGINDTTSRSTPVTTFAGGTNWKQTSSSGYTYIVFPSVIDTSSTSAIKTDGTLWVWGSNNGYYTSLGTGDAIERSTPVTTFAGGTNWKQVSTGGVYRLSVQSGINAEYPLS
jgi:alpha-tubulin suppressor-like RCC1 family protein